MKYSGSMNSLIYIRNNKLFEIKANSLPYIPWIAKAYNMSQMRYKNSPHALVELRKAFKEAGLRKQEREVTYAIKHSGFVKAKKEGNLLLVLLTLVYHIHLRKYEAFFYSPKA